MKNETLETLRLTLNISKKDLAEALDITQQSYTNYSKGRRDIPASLAIKIKKKYNISIDWLLTGKGVMKISESEILLNDIDNMAFALSNDLSNEAKQIVELLPYASSIYISEVIQKLQDFKEFSIK